MSNNLLKDAIADAKALRETALVNARQQIEEAFKPQLGRMISDRLRTESLMEDNDGSSEIGGGAVTVKEPAPKMPSKTSNDSSHVQNPKQEFTQMGDETQKLPIKEGEDFHHEEDDQFEDPTVAAPDMGMDDGMGGEPDMGMDAGMGGEPDELDLDAIIRELELDLDGDDGMGDEMGDPSMDAAPRESFDQAQAGTEVNGAFDGALKEDAEGVTTDGKSPTAVDGVNGGKKVTPGQVVTATSAETMKEGEEIDLDEILREMEAEEATALGETSGIANENVELKRSIREHREVIQFLRTKLHEVNMLNSKLLFTNKLFKSFDLKLEQKMRVVETFDRANTIREVKLIYSTLAESLKTGFSGPRKNTRAITEGIASKPIRSTAPKSQQIISENDDNLKARMQKLAGIFVS